MPGFDGQGMAAAPAPAQAEDLLAGFHALSEEERDRFLGNIGVGVPIAEESSEASTADVVVPTRSQLKKYALITAVPYIGFGFADNFLMLIFGEQLELYFGAKFHLSTLAAAGLGNLFSDIVGIGLGGVIEEGAEKMGIPPHQMTLEQMHTTSAKVVYGTAAVVGITIGCLLGMCPLLRHDPDEQRLKVLFRSFDTDGSGDLDRSEIVVAFQRCHIFMSKEEFDKLFEEFDTEEPFGKFDFEEFKAMYNKTTVEMRDKFRAVADEVA